jgi:hypothetical protein
MFEFGIKMSEAAWWIFANKHPYLFTLIQVTQPYIFVIIAVIGINIINKLFYGKK